MAAAAACTAGSARPSGCEINAKSSTLASVIPKAEKTGRCEIRAESYVRKIDLDAAGRVERGVVFRRPGPGAAAEDAGGGGMRQRGGDAAAAADVEIETAFPTGWRIRADWWAST